MADTLPEEILQHIFSYLDVGQRLEASLVCKTWLRALDRPSLLEDIGVSNKGNSMLNELHDTTRKFPCVYFYDTEIDDACINLLNRIGPQLLHLRFRNCTLRHQGLPIHGNGEKHYELGLRSQVYNCTNLKNLDGGHDIWIIFSYLPSLQSVQTVNYLSPALTDHLIMALDEIIPPSLKKLSMLCNVACDTKDYIGFYPELKIFENPSDKIMTLPVMAHFIKKRSKTLISLELQPTLSADAALELCQGSNLQHLSLCGCQTFIDIIPDLCRSQPRLVAINLNRTWYLTDDIVNKICAILPNLKIFKAECTVINASVESVFRMRHLKKINLSECSKITPDSFARAVVAFAANDLRFLDLSKTCIEAPFLQQLFPRVKRLTYLDLSRCPQVSDPTLVAISRHLLLLRELTLADCSGITDDGMTGRCDAIPVPLSNIRGLISLDISGCHQITGAGIMEAICFSHLSVLDLSDGPNLTSMNEDIVWVQNPQLALIVEGLPYKFRLRGRNNI